MPQFRSNPCRLVGAIIAALLPLAASAQVQQAPQQQDAEKTGTASPAPAPKPAANKPPPIVHPFGWANDYSYLADPAKRTGAAWERWSYIPLGKDPSWYLTLGGEIRYNYNDYDHTALGVRADKNSMLQQRLRASADVHLGRNFRFFLELGDNREFFEETPTPPNNDRLDVQQAFFDASFDVGDGNRLTIRPGRFLMPLGDGVLIGLRDGVNVRYTYDGVRAMLSLKNGAKIDAFYVNPTTYEDAKTFDDSPDQTRDFSGVYFSKPFKGKPAHNYDFFFYNSGRDVASYQAGRGQERRYSAGARIWAKTTRPWDYDAEAVYQWGDFAGGDISAWGVLLGAGYTFTEARFTPRIGTRLNIFSGDHDLTDGKIGTFVPPYPRTPLYTDAGWFNMMNLGGAHVDVTWTFKPNLTVTTGTSFLWRESTDDAIYFGPTSAPLATVPGDERHVATTLNLQSDYQVNRFLNFHFFYTHVLPGGALKKAGGDVSNFYGLWAQLRF